MNGKTGPWIRSPVPTNVLERWRHTSPRMRIGPPATRARVSGAARSRSYGRYIRRDGTMRNVSARSAQALRSRTRTMARTRSRNRRRFGRRRRYPGRTLQPLTVARWLTTAHYESIDCAAGTLTTGELFLNSAKDPMGVNSATEQPLGFEQYEALYRKYAVVAWKVSIECVSTDNTNPVVVGFTPTTNSTGLTTWQQYSELPGTVQKVVTPDVDKLFMGTRGGVKKWLAPRGSKILSNEELCALTTANPTRLLYGHFYAQSLDGSADPAKVHFKIKLRQMIVFFDPITPARSTQ